MVQPLSIIYGEKETEEIPFWKMTSNSETWSWTLEEKCTKKLEIINELQKH